MITVPENILSKLSNNQQILIKALSKRPHMSKALSRLGVSNKSHVLNRGNDIKGLLASIGLAVTVIRVSKQYLWSLQYLPPAEQSEVV